jgi:hypothetical protein
MSNEIKENVLAILEANNITMRVQFVPFRVSRNKAEKYPSLNYLITIERNNKEILTTDYMQAFGHCPSYKQRATHYSNQAVEAECDTGLNHVRLTSRGLIPSKVKIEPNIVDVMYSLVLDSNVLDYPTFERWASDFGYNSDSRQDEKTYKACLDIALKLKNGLGDTVLNELREALQDY